MGSEIPPKECLVCLNSNETILVPKNEESQKIFNICSSYVKDAINIEFLIKNINRNNSQLSFCINCFHSSLNLSLLVEQLSKLKKEINDLASCFSEKIGQQRIQAKANPATLQFKDGNIIHQTVNNQKRTNIYTDSSDTSSSDSLSSSSDSESDSDIHSDSESSVKLIGELSAIDKKASEIGKTKIDVIHVDSEDESRTDNLPCYKEKQSETNHLVTVSENATIGSCNEIKLEQTSETDSFNTINESEPQTGTSKSFAELISSVKMPNIILERIRNDALTNSDGTFNSTETSHQDESRVNFDKNIAGSSDRNCNSMSETTNMKRKKRKLGKKSYNCLICEKCFRTPHKLNRHNKSSHSKEKTHKCVICEKSFTELQNLRSHERLHTGEMPYKCSLCYSSFRSSNLLRYHETTHSDESDDDERNPTTPAYHETTRIHHTGEMRYKCSTCDKSFCSFNLLQCHETTHSDDDERNPSTPAFKCFDCEKVFDSKKSRLRHQNKIHPHVL